MSVLFNNQYEGKTVLVTGHTGFKGSWLTQWLVQLGAKVIGVSSNIPTTPNHFERLNLENQIEDHRLDIRDLEPLTKCIKKAKPDMVFHLAAQSIVRTAYLDPIQTFQTNINGTMNVLQACKDQPNIQTIIMITSDKAYRNKEWVWGYKEEDELGGDDPYSASKGCAELIIRSYVKSFFKNSNIRVATGRAGNVIGGGDWSDYRIIPDCVKAWSAGNELEIRSPKATRPWQHVLEPLSGYLWLGAQLLQAPKLHGEAFNFGPDANVNQSVEELLQTFSEYWDKAKWRVNRAKNEAIKENSLLKLCCDKALLKLKWKANLSFEQTVRFTAEWYAHYYNTSTISTCSQIQEYIDIAQNKGLLWAKT